MNRRGFLARLGFGTVAAAAAACSFDVEKLLWRSTRFSLSQADGTLLSGRRRNMSDPKQPLMQLAARHCGECGDFLRYLDDFSAPQFTARAVCQRCERGWIITLQPDDSAVPLPTYPTDVS